MEIFTATSYLTLKVLLSGKNPAVDGHCIKHELRNVYVMNLLGRILFFVVERRKKIRNEKLFLIFVPF